MPGRGLEEPRFDLGELESDACRTWSCVAVWRRQRWGMGVPRRKVRRRVWEEGIAAIECAVLKKVGKETL